MAPAKRTRTAQAQEDDEEDHRRRDSAKRRRRDDSVDLESNADGPSVLEDEDASDVDITNTQWGGNRDRYERERDEMEINVEEDEQIERRATQDLVKFKEKKMQNQAQECGIIESLTCTNFMCHTKLHVALGPLINFIIGHNGSGKSAVLTGITLCLGGKATATNRGQSLKSFIKEGTQKAILEVRIKNQGDQAFRRDVYGDTITVERSFDQNGTSGFKLRATNGKVVSEKRAELDDITDFYALQLDNPVNVLTQDMARQFLNSSSGAEKYKFFMKGVQLEQLDNDYNLLSDSLDAVDAHLESVAEDETALRLKLAEDMKKVEDAKKQDNMRERMTRYQRQMAWAQVEEQERGEQDARKKIEDQQKKIAIHEQNFAKADEVYQVTLRALEAAQKQLEEVGAELPPLEEQHENAKEALGQKDKELAELQAEQRGVKLQLENAKTRSKKLQDSVNEERQRLEAADGGSQARMMQEIEVAEGALAEARQKFEEHPGAKEQLDRNRTTADIKLRDAREALKRKQDEVDTQSQRFNTLRNQQPRPLSAYHNSIHNLLRAIEHETRWRTKPVGPLGEHIRLLKPEWSSIIETVLGGTLNAFVVDNKADQTLLSSIMKRVQWQVHRINAWHGQVNIVDRNFIDTSRNEPDGAFATIMRVLQIDNDLVRNQLIINHAIEQIILIANRDDAMRTMYPTNGSSPQNVRFAITQHPNKQGMGIRLVAGNNTRSDPIRRWDRQARIRTDMEAQINMQRQFVDSLKREIQPLESVVTDLQNELRRCDQALLRHNKESQNLRLARQTSEQHLQNLREQLDAAKPQDGVLDTLKDQLREAEEEAAYLRSQYDQASEARVSLTSDRAELARAVSAAKAAVDQQHSHINEAKAREQKAELKRRSVLLKKNEKDQDIKDAKKEMEILEDNLQTAINQVEDFTRQASGFCLRVPVDAGETANSLDKKLEKMQEALNRATRALGATPAELMTRAAQAKERYRRARNQHKAIKQLRQNLLTSLGDRQYRWKKFRQHISCRARSHFTYLLSERNFRGRMQIHHLEKHLELLVEPDAAVQRAATDQQGRSTKTLSGGEKSFSTICMLLAMWDAMGSPIRCLDEFDVFMDNVNRDISMRMLIDAARRSVGRQYILISPQAMGNVNLGADVKVIKLSDPERGQRVIGDGMRVE